MSFFFSEVVEVCLGKKSRARERECCNFYFWGNFLKKILECTCEV